MSIESAIEDNTAALVALRKALVAGLTPAATSPTPASGVSDVKKTEPKKVDKKAAEAKPAQPATTTGATPAANGPSLKLVTDTVLDFAAENGAQAKEILKSFGVSRITELKPATYPDILAAVAKAKEKIAAELLTGNDDVDSLV